MEVFLTNENLLEIPPFIMIEDMAQVRGHMAQVRLIFPKGKYYTPADGELQLYLLCI